MLENRAQMFGDDKIEQVRLTQMKRELHIGKETYKSEDLYIQKETYTILETRTNILRRQNREGETHNKQLENCAQTFGDDKIEKVRLL